MTEGNIPAPPSALLPSQHIVQTDHVNSCQEHVCKSACGGLIVYVTAVGVLVRVQH